MLSLNKTDFFCLRKCERYDIRNNKLQTINALNHVFVVTNSLTEMVSQGSIQNTTGTEGKISKIEA